MRYLIFGGPGIGDTIFEIMFAKMLKSSSSDVHVDLLTATDNDSNKLLDSLLLCQGYIDRHYSWSRKNYFRIIQTMVQLIKNRYDYGFSCSSSFKSNNTAGRVCKIIGCKSVVKFVEGKTGKVDFPVVISENIHFVEQYKKLADVIYQNVAIDVNVLDINKIPNNGKYKKEKQRITIAIGTNPTIYQVEKEKIKINIKEWGIRNWILVGNFLFDAGYEVYVVGGSKDKESILGIKDYKFKHGINVLCGETTLQESLCIIKDSDLVVGADTGMLHCAAALNVKTISLFGGTDYKVWRPYSTQNYVFLGKSNCSPCYGKNVALKCKNRECMSSIKYEDVIDMIKKVI
ncbi:MAG: glycosyltransferase family 9 protein [Anaerovibrio sp.]